MTDELDKKETRDDSYQISEEEKAKILASLDAIKAQLGQEDTLNHVIAENEAKLIDCKHEIVISLIAQVMIQDDVNLKVGTREICRRNYHIPVPEGVEYNIYLKGFFDFLEQCMSTSVESMEANTTNETQEEEQV